MSERRGGPAFPTDNHMVELERADGGREWHVATHPGMALRDWFAGQALAGMGTWMPFSAERAYHEGISLTSEFALNERAAWAYAQADAMLAARAAE